MYSTLENSQETAHAAYQRAECKIRKAERAHLLGTSASRVQPGECQIHDVRDVVLVLRVDHDEGAAPT